MTKTFGECNVCGDIHYGDVFPEACPSCSSTDAYEEIDREEAMEAIV